MVVAAAPLGAQRLWLALWLTACGLQLAQAVPDAVNTA
jgi:hypothetical protein